MTLTPPETELTIRMLEMFSETLSNAGCNDFDSSLVIPNAAERDKIYKTLCEWNGDSEEYEPYEGSGPDYRMMDWMIVDYLAARLKGEVDA